MRRLAITLAVLFLATAAPEPAAASTGQITRASINATFTAASLAGRVDWTDCVTARCLWVPYATVQPSTAEYACTGDEIFDDDPNTKVVWNGERSVNGTAVFDLPHAPVLAGVRAQRVCLSVAERRLVQEPVCVAESPGRGEDPATCPFFDRWFMHVLATQPLTVRPPSPPTPAGSAPTLTPAPGAQPTVLSLDRAKPAAKKALARRFGRRWARGSARRLRCRRLTATRARCSARWRYAESAGGRR